MSSTLLLVTLSRKACFPHFSAFISISPDCQAALIPTAINCSKCHSFVTFANKKPWERDSHGDAVTSYQNFRYEENRTGNLGELTGVSMPPHPATAQC